MTRLNSFIKQNLVNFWHQILLKVDNIKYSIHKIQIFCFCKNYFKEFIINEISFNQKFISLTTMMKTSLVFNKIFIFSLNSQSINKSIRKEFQVKYLEAKPLIFLCSKWESFKCIYLFQFLPLWAFFTCVQ